EKVETYLEGIYNTVIVKDIEDRQAVYIDAFGFFRNCPFFASNEIISVIKCWYQIKAVYDNE
ncbi:MAG: hypothetical protein ACI4CT_06185, partial [Lachnospiraceae bacterium]